MSRSVVVLVNYRGAQDTSVCLRSLYASDVVPLVVIVDNTPNDMELPDVMTQYPDVHLIRASENLGFGGGNNLGIEWALSHTDSEFIFIFNNDATVAHDTITRLEKAMDADPNVGIVTCRIVLTEDTTKLWYGGGCMDWRRGGAVTPGINGSSESALALNSRYVDFASGCAMLVRRELLLNVGFFDSRFFMYEEDINLCLRAKQNNYKIWYEADALVVHGRQGSLRKTGEEYFPPLHPLNPNVEFYLYHTVRNRIINIVELMSGRERGMYIIGFTIWLLRHAMRYVWHGNISTVKTLLRAVRSGLKAVGERNSQ